MLPEQFGTYFNVDKSAISTFRLPSKIGDRRRLTAYDFTETRGKQVRSAVENHIFKTFPEGARGSIYIPHTSGAHFVSFRRTADGVHIDNPQDLGADLTTFWTNVISNGTPGSARYGIQAIRLDNATINRTYLDEMVTKDLGDTNDVFETLTVRGGKAVAKLFGNGKKFDPSWRVNLQN